ncbi:hypothetical protein JCM8547_001408 [Rhodosporidiobolus lusitaniae]
MASVPTLRVQAKTSPAPYGLVALAYSLPPAQLHLDYVHSFPTDAPKGTAVSFEAGGKIVYGTTDVFRALGQAFVATGIYGHDAKDTADIEAQLLNIPPFPATFPTALAFLSQLEQRLTLRTFLVSHAPTLADYACFSALKTNVIALPLLAKTPHTQRWFTSFGKRPEVVKALTDVPAQAKVKPVLEKQKKEDKEDKANATFELGLPNAVKGQVVTRLPPEPSGYLHIGHAKAAVLNQYFARMYEGKFLVRFDDTNPSKEKAEFEQSIVEDLALLGIKADATSYTSDYFDQLQQYAVQMIKLGKAYADDTEQEVMRDQRMNGVPSARRESSVEDSLAHFAEMATGSPEGRRWCLRAKISFSDPNKAMRDPVIYRVNADTPHHRTGLKYKIYPTYDFCCPIVDCLEGVTHALRTNEYRDRNPQYYWMLEALGLRKVEVWDFGRLAFVYTLLSKRKLKWFVEEGHVGGWDDPRFPTVRGIRRRGMTIEAITQFMLLQGPSQAFLNLEWDSIWNLNKKVIDPVAPRFVALEKEKLVPVKVIGGAGAPPAGQVVSQQLPKHKKNPDVGLKTTFYSNSLFIEQADAASFAQDEEVTLMDWGNAFVRSIKKTESGEVESLEVELNLEGDFKKTKKKVTWLASPEEGKGKEGLTPVELVDYDYLITKKKLEEDDSVEELLNPKTEYRTPALADYNVSLLPVGTIIQFERKGFYIVDRASSPSSPSEPAVLIFIPDGKASSIVLKYQPPVAEKGAKKEGEKKKGATSAKDKVAAAAQKKASTAAEGSAGGLTQIPELAPKEAVEVTLKSDGTKGFDIPVKTKMYYSPPINGGHDYPVPVKTDMFEVPPVHKQA